MTEIEVSITNVHINIHDACVTVDVRLDPPNMEIFDVSITFEKGDLFPKWRIELPKNYSLIHSKEVEPIKFNTGTFYQYFIKEIRSFCESNEWMMDILKIDWNKE